jgi:hypothetical protein
MDTDSRKGLSMLTGHQTLSLLLIQIAGVTLAFYATFHLISYAADSTAGYHHASGRILSFPVYSRSSPYFYSNLIALFLTIPFLAVAYVYLVRKANKVLEFFLTKVLIHWVLCMIYSREFGSFSFFIVIGAYAVTAILIIEWICLKVEQSDSFGFSGMLDVTRSMGLTPRNEYESLKVIEI